MQRNIDAPADELREEASQHQQAAKEIGSPEAKKDERKKADVLKRKAIDIENDLA
jgi:hypothetical protein